jgi:hypothetical protein
MQWSLALEFYARADLPIRIDKIAQIVEASQHIYDHHRPAGALAGKHRPNTSLAGVQRNPPLPCVMSQNGSLTRRRFRSIICIQTSAA